MHFALRWVVLGAVASVTLGCGGKKRVQNPTKESQEVLAKQNAEEIRGLCLHPPKHQNRWNATVYDKAGQAAACEWLERNNAESLAKLQAEVQALGGVECLARVEKHWSQHSHRDDWRMPTETDAARREKYAPIAEPCVAALEKRVAAEAPEALYLAVFGHWSLFKQPALSEAQHARLAPFTTTVPSGAKTAWEARAAALQKDQPLASAARSTRPTSSAATRPAPRAPSVT